MKLIGRLICWFKGHKRGKLLTSVFDARIGKNVTVYACPRCGRQSIYKTKVPG